MKIYEWHKKIIISVILSIWNQYYWFDKYKIQTIEILKSF